jgi:hypothetical protein
LRQTHTSQKWFHSHKFRLRVIILRISQALCQSSWSRFRRGVAAQATRECLTVPEEAPAYLFTPSSGAAVRSLRFRTMSSDARLPAWGSKMSGDKPAFLADREEVNLNSRLLIDLRPDSPGPISWKEFLRRRIFLVTANPGAIRCSRFWVCGYAPGFASSKRS